MRWMCGQRRLRWTARTAWPRTREDLGGRAVMPLVRRSHKGHSPLPCLPAPLEGPLRSGPPTVEAPGLRWRGRRWLLLGQPELSALLWPAHQEAAASRAVAGGQRKLWSHLGMTPWSPANLIPDC
ncbi:hypothetical protein GUJ93_ZPchr0003g18500 [Zizania palustris]|uniref:Uncharacterized protein n=1 Tax=Zizania palustris TaxID=103762 RepID=A0A8J5VJI3_ZIZPA|nr:hypothetical protein GUJ93_ZPchr0003g18500 [Zizania palustris]